LRELCELPEYFLVRDNSSHQGGFTKSVATSGQPGWKIRQDAGAPFNQASCCQTATAISETALAPSQFIRAIRVIRGSNFWKRFPNS
jgi:hypothetical protein